MKDIAIGIDLGTTNSCAAYYYNGKSREQLKIVLSDEGGRLFPSYIFLEKKSAIVGHYAKDRAESRPECGIHEIKRLIGRKFDDPRVCNNLEYFSYGIENQNNEPLIVVGQRNDTVRKTPQDLCALILQKIKADTEKKLGNTVEKAVITVPAYFNVTQREATLAAANKAGFTVLQLLNEPTAAALSYYFQNEITYEKYTLVYDLGGGTFDVAVLKKNDANIDIIAVDGDTYLGGTDFDNLIVNYVCSKLEKYKYNPKSDRRVMRRLRTLCEEAKRMLSAAEDTIIGLVQIVPGHDSVEITLTRKTFEELADTLFRRTIDIMDTCLKNCNISKADITNILLSGGSTRIPKIRTMVSQYFNGKELNHFNNPDECVAEGAAIQAAMLSNNPKQAIKIIKITDVVPLSLGVSDFVGRMNFLIKKNTPIPVTESHVRINVYDQQDSMYFKFYEGERLIAAKNHYLGEMTLSNITPAPPGQCEVTFAMTVDHNGILKISAKENCRNNIKDLKVVYTRGHMSDGEVKNALKDAEDHRKEDKLFENFAAVKNYVMNYCIRAKFNFENKKLFSTHREVYDYCCETERKARCLNVEDKKKIKSLMEEIKRRCDPLVEIYRFQFMPDLPKFTTE